MDGAGYVEPSNPNARLEGEVRGTDEGGARIIRQVVQDPVALAELRLVVQALAGAARDATVEAVRAEVERLAGLTSTETTLAALLAAIQGQPDPEVGLAKEATLASLLAATLARPDPETGLAKDATLLDVLAAAQAGSREATLLAVFEEVARLVKRDETQAVRDVFQFAQYLPDQVSTGTVLRFQFTPAVELVWVRSRGGLARATIGDGGLEPTPDLGIFVEADEPAPITMVTDVVNVWASAGATVSVWGYHG